MSDPVFDELGIPNPKYNLGVNSSTQASQTGTIMAELEPILKQESDLVLVYGGQIQRLQQRSQQQNKGCRLRILKLV